MSVPPWRTSSRAMRFEARPVSAAGALKRVSNAAARPCKSPSVSNQSRSPGPPASGSALKLAARLAGLARRPPGVSSHGSGRARG